MITNADITKLKKVFVTKQELKETENRLIKYINYKTDRLEESIKILSNELADFKKEMMEFKDHMYKTLDFLVGSYKKFDEEHSILTTRYSTIGKTIDNHETRISILEKKPS